MLGGSSLGNVNQIAPEQRISLPREILGFRKLEKGLDQFGG
jgi:hypothetical protein